MSDVKPPKPRKRLNLAGQVKHSSMKDAFKAIENTMGELHIQTHERAKLERKGR